MAKAEGQLELFPRKTLGDLLAAWRNEAVESARLELAKMVMNKAISMPPDEVKEYLTGKL